MERKSSICGLLIWLELQRMATGELNVIELIKVQNTNLCREPTGEEQDQSGPGLKASTNSLYKSKSMGRFIPNK